MIFRGSTLTSGCPSFYPFRATRSGSVPTDKLFTGQRLDGTGLYYYGARYYDPTIGRFISADTIVPGFANPQSLNRYSYCLNNPLKYTDPSGNYEITAYPFPIGSLGPWGPGRSSGGFYGGSIGEKLDNDQEFRDGFAEAFLFQIYGSSPPYMCYESCVGLYEVITGQRSIWDTNTPAEMWQDIKAYYDPSIPRGLGRI